MYFSNFPNILYDFSINGVKEYRVIKDITQNVRIRKQVMENIALYDEYDIVEGETPEIISEKIYGTPEYHWVIMLVNQRYDYISDFPLTTRELDAYVEDKYGDKKYLAHHYEYLDPVANTRMIKNGFNILRCAKKLGEAGGLIPGVVVRSGQHNEYIGIVDEATLTDDGEYSLIKVTMRNGQFQSGTGALVGNVNYVFIGDVYSVTIPEPYYPVSNYQYEESVNESKRRIKLISPEYIDQIIREFEEIL